MSIFRTFFFSILISLATQSVSAQFSSVFHWTDSFSPKEKEKLSTWVTEVGDAVEKTIGTYPFEVQIYFHKTTQGSGPVPWAHTSRDGEESVHFYVNTGYPLQAFLNDWTAAHEIAHLSIPFIGERYRWFSEGYASYMQWQVMHIQGLLSQDNLREKYLDKIAQTTPKYNSDVNFIALTRSLKSRYDYPALYYGGACFFIQANAELLKLGTTLPKLISLYQAKGRRTDDNLYELIKSLDALVEKPVFTNLFNKFLSSSGKETVGVTAV